jgi:hypothetical protein
MAEIRTPQRRIVWSAEALQGDMRTFGWMCGLEIVASCSHPRPPRTAVVASDACAPRADAEAQVVKRVVEMYAALAADDVTRFRAVVAPGFYAFDGGERYDGDALANMTATAHAAGKRFEWTVTDPVVRIDCSTALITYTNVGSMGDATSMQPRSWLESATLRYTDGTWRLAFFHSTRVPKPAP